MSTIWQIDLARLGREAPMILPPATVEESAWDILIALHGDEGCSLTLPKLAALTSVPSDVLTRELAALEELQLIAGVQNEVTREVRAILTPQGRALLDRYFSAADGLRIGAGR
jgi:DNA-binding MarR family transcriptional regulator